MIESKRMTWGGYVIFMGKKKNQYRVLLRRLKIRYHLENLGIG